MKRFTNHDELIADVLDDAAPGFREQLLARTVQLARRKRVARRTRRACAVLAVAGLLAMLSLPRPGIEPPAQQDPGFAIVESKPLPMDAIIATTPLNPDQITRSGAGVTIISTADHGRVPREIDDRELLERAPPAAVLVRIGPGSARLVFPADDG